MTSVRDAVRVFNKHDRAPLRKELRHTVVADRSADGFILPLPYGTGVDWLRNVLAAGRATITVGGKTYDVVEPEIIDAASAAPQLSPRRQRAFQRFGIDSFVKVKLAK